MSLPHSRYFVQSAVLAVALCWSSARAAAQTVVELQGGGSSLADGYGATANFWRSGMDGWVGIGYMDGFRAGAFLRKATAGKDTLGIGNTALVMRLPTDVFMPGYNLLVQGVSYAGGSEGTSYMLFGGASSAGTGAPSFQPTNIEQPMGAFFLQHLVEPRVRLTAAAIIAERQTFLPGVQWQPTPDLTAGFVTGMGSDRPYAASSVTLQRGRLGVVASYTWNPDRFRRVAVPTPNQTEVDRENIMVTYDLGPQFSIGAGRQNFVQDSADAAPVVRAVGNTVFAGGRWRELRLTGGLYHSQSGGVSNVSSYFALGRELTSWLDAEIFLLQSRPQGQPSVTTPVANLRWRISPRVGVSQQVSLHHGRPTVLLGASLITRFGEFAADYQIVHQPLRPLNPFRSALNLTARLQLGSYSTSLGTYVRPDGAVDYSASGSTFLYMGTFGGVQPQQVGGRMSRYLVRGSVRDEQGRAIEGAAVDLNGEVIYTNSTGDFFLRSKHPQQYPIKILLSEFLLPGDWEIVRMPQTVTAAEEQRALPVTIILRRPPPPGAQ